MCENIEELIVRDKSGIRIDKYLGDNLEGLSRSYIKKLIDDGKVLVNGIDIKAKYKVEINDNITIEIPEPQEINVVPEKIDLEIVFEDEHVIVVNKNQGMVVHPAPGNYNGTLVNALMHHCKGNLSQINGKIRPGIVHRIDKDTSGLLVVAKTNPAHIELSKQVKAHSFTRKYIALVNGVVKEKKGKIDMPIGRHPKDRKKMSINTHSGRDAVTYFTIEEIFNNHTLLECQLETGRTHQIRVHLSAIGYPIVGDPVYGYKNNQFNLKGQALHAKILGFIHPINNKYMEFAAPLPDYFSKLLNILRLG